MELTKVQEEYLKCIYLLQGDSDGVRVTDVAEKLNKTKATVNFNVGNLCKMGFLEHKTYGDIVLTTAGVNSAKKILEAYDIVYLFLNEILKLEPKKAENEATKIKAIIDDDTLNKLARYTHKELGLYSLECGYDINKESCRSCLRRSTVKNN